MLNKITIKDMLSRRELIITRNRKILFLVDTLSDEVNSYPYVSLYKT